MEKYKAIKTMLKLKILRLEYQFMIIVLFDKALHAKDKRNKSFKQ